tara:strand:+ start:1598 stop:2602 length:1005 start_codon:yes stop_codon:yes gene_type:complete
MRKKNPLNIIGLIDSKKVIKYLKSILKKFRDTLYSFKGSIKNFKKLKDKKPSNIYGLVDSKEFLKYSESMLKKVRAASCTFKETIKSGDFIFYCSFCKKMNLALGSDYWNLRNQVICESCKLPSRNRHLFEIIETLKPPEKDLKIIIFEDVTEFAKKLKSKYKNLITSEFFPGLTSGQKVRYKKIKNYHITNQDIQKTSYKSNSIDLMIHGDVYEHIPSIKNALIEARRILKKDGIMIFTMPLYDNLKKTTIRAKLKNGNINHIHEPMYHGNPIDDKGALVFSDPGKDFLDLANKYGFKIKISMGFDPFKGYFSDCHEIDTYHCWNSVFVFSKK